MPPTVSARNEYPAYNIPAVIVLGVVLLGFFCWTVAAVIIRVANDRGITLAWGDIGDFALTAQVCLRAGALSLCDAFDFFANAFPRRRRESDDYELTPRSSLSGDAATAPAWSLPGNLAHSHHGSPTQTEGASSCRPNTPDEPTGGADLSATKDTAIGVSETPSIGVSETPSVLEADALPWESFVPPWDLIAAISTPRASSVLEATTGHSGGHSSVDIVDVKV